MADPDQLPVERYQLLVLPAPRIRPPIVRIRKSAQPGLIAVVHGRRARKCHLQHGGFLKNSAPRAPFRIPGCKHSAVPIAVIFVSVLVSVLAFVRKPSLKGLFPAPVLRPLLLAKPSHDPAGAGKKSCVVVIGKLIHADRQGGLRYFVLIQETHAPPERLGIADQLGRVHVAVLVHSGEKPAHRIHKSLVIHDPVPFPAAQPGGRIGVVLGQNERVRIRLLDGLSEPLPKIVIELLGMPKIRRDIQTPAVRVKGRRDPLGRNAQDLLHQLLRSLVIEFGQRLIAPPAVIYRRLGPVLLYKLKKVVIGRILPLIGAGGVPLSPGINTVPIHPIVRGPAVIEDPVNDHPHPAGMGLPHEIGKQPVTRLQIFRTRDPRDIQF